MLIREDMKVFSRPHIDDTTRGKILSDILNGY